MSSRRETTESERLLVVKWSKEGKSLREIASLIGVTHGCVQKILQKYKKTGSVANIPGRGRKEILSTTVKRKIIHSVKKDPRIFQIITINRNTLRDLQISFHQYSRTLRKVLQLAVTSLSLRGRKVFQESVEGVESARRVFVVGVSKWGI
ncbi:uncharacterized protein TNCT_255521 [Trichonephila clavata]|uniref:Paired domain-containing protein n=1 Tax=Trichonephila clavata TaxID=2740835 RepID=A0A8X6K0H0_TRICU|nr:uncharacterized protein TNCT_255521 [Trichonephila clavata]